MGTNEFISCELINNHVNTIVNATQVTAQMAGNYTIIMILRDDVAPGFKNVSQNVTIKVISSNETVEQWQPSSVDIFVNKNSEQTGSADEEERNSTSEKQVQTIGT